METLDQDSVMAMGEARPIERRPALVRVVDAEHPRAPSSRHDLRGVETVAIGRGDEFAVRREGTTLELVLPDGRVSTAHARIERDARGWSIADLGSKNGTLIDGRTVQAAALVSGDVIELGRTFLLFEEAATFEPFAARDTDSSTLPVVAPELATLVGELAWELGRVVELAETTVPIMLAGETGTGKEVIARIVHRLSKRPGELVAVNCGALVPTLLESELFGAKRGAFSGATEDRIGLVRAADRGTLFLDEIGDLPLASQAAFLRVLQEHEVLPVGGARAVAVDFRLISATHRSLEALVATDAFRRDLRARITGFEVRLPPVRERRADLGLLVGAILGRLTSAPIRFAPPAIRALLLYDWPDNVRELHRVLETAVALAKDGTIRLEHLPANVSAALEPHHASKTLGPDEAKQKARLVELLVAHKGNVSAVAREMGKQRAQIHRWMQRFDIDPDAYR